MKELTIAQKAQRYDEAIEKLRDFYRDYDTVSCLIDVKDELANLFPELKESEGEDERMVKFIKNQLFNIKKTITENYELDAKLTKAIDWLEKQGEPELSNDLGEYIAELSKQFPEVSFAKLSRIAVRVKNWLEKQGNHKPIDKIQLGKKYKCIASPRYSTFRRGNIYKPVDNFLCNLMNLCYECFEPIEDSEQKPADKVEPFDKYEGLTDFERTLADICIGWIGEELGWKQYIKDNADVLLKIAMKKLYSAQDVAFEQKPTELSQLEVTKTSDQVQKPAEWSLPYGKNETAEDLIALAECLETEGDCLFNRLTGDEYGKLLRELAKEIKSKHAEEVRDPYERCVQYQSVEAGIKAHAEIYSFNIDSELFPQLTKEQQKLWRKEIEYACISGGDMGYILAKDPRYKENHEVKEVNLEEYLKESIEGPKTQKGK